LSDIKKREEKDVLIEARKILGMTQQQVANKAYVAVRHYQMFESGQRKLTTSTLSLASRILEALELDITAFVRGEYLNCEKLFPPPQPSE